MLRAFDRKMSLRAVGTGIAIAAAIALVLPFAPAQAATNGWSFTGSVAAPARDGDGVLSVSGTVVVPSCPDQSRGCWLAMHRSESGADAGWVAVNGASGPIVFRAAGVFAFTGTATISGGTWQFGVVAGISGGFRQGNVIADGLSDPLSVPSVSSTRLVTTASSTSIVLGDPVTISAAQSVTWSDGVITQRAVNGYGELGWRATGSGTWSRVASGDTTATLTPTGPGDYRYHVDGTGATTVFVDVARPTSANRIAIPTISATEAIANSTLTLTTTMETQYDDGQWRPSPAGTKYELQFLADGGTAWARLYSNTITTAGEVEIRFPMLSSGRYRVMAGTATSASLPVTAIVPTSTVALEPLELPEAVQIGEPIDVSIGADVLYSDGVYRDAPDQTPFAIQFAISDSGASASRAKLRWRTVEAGKTRNGRIAAQMIVRKAGYWRIRCGKATTSAQFVRIRASRTKTPRDVPAVFNGSITYPDRRGGSLVLAGDVTVPNDPVCTTGNHYANSPACELGIYVTEPGRVVGRYLIRAQSSGILQQYGGWDQWFKGAGTYYVEASFPMPEWASNDATFQVGVIAGAWHRICVGMNAYPCLDNGTPGYLVGNIGEPFKMPYRKSSTTTSRSSSSSVTLGESVTVSVSSHVVWSDGLESDEPVAGLFELQWRATGAGQWQEVASGSSSLTVSPTAPGDYRFLIDGQITPPVYVNVVRPTSANRLANVAVTPTTAMANVSLGFSATIETQYDDQKWRPSPIGTTVELQFLAEGSTAWTRVAATTVTAAGSVAMRWPMLGTGRFRLTSGGAISESVAVTAIVPTPVVAIDPIDVPTEVYPGEPLDISVGVDVQYSDGLYRDAPDGTGYEVEFAESFDPGSGTSFARGALIWKTIRKGQTSGGVISVSLAPNTSGFWRIAMGDAMTTPVYVAVVGSKPTTPGSVGALRASKVVNGSVAVYWSPVNGNVTAYQYRTATASGKWRRWINVGMQTRAVIKVAGRQGARTIQVRALNGTSAGPTSSLRLPLR